MSPHPLHSSHVFVNRERTLTTITLIFLLNKQEHYYYQTCYTYDEEDFTNIVSLNSLHMYLVFLQIQKTLHMLKRLLPEASCLIREKKLIFFIPDRWVKKVKERTIRLAVCVIFVSRGLDRYLTASWSRVESRPAG